MEYMLILSEDPELVASDEQRRDAFERVGEYAMGLLGNGTLKGGSPLRTVTEAKRVRTREGRAPRHAPDGSRRGVTSIPSATCSR